MAGEVAVDRIIEKAISLISPKWAFERQRYASAAKLIRNYDAAKTDQQSGNWNPVSNMSAELTDRGYRTKIVSRARDMERNSDIVESVVGGIVRNVVGTGIRLQARVMDKNGKADEKLNKQIEELWNEWCMPENCDITGHQSFAELQAMALRRRIVDGEVLTAKVWDKSAGLIPFRLQMLEPDLFDTVSTNSPGGTIIQSGIELDQYGRPLAYHLYELSPDGYTTLKSKRIPAEQIIHMFGKTRPTQIRGVCELARILNRVRDTGEFLDADLVAARVAACFAAFVTSDDTEGRLGRMEQAADGSKDRRDTLSPGIIEFLKPGESVEIATPNRTASTAKEYAGLMQRMAGAGMGLSYEIISRDMSQSTYSSARAGNLEDRKTFVPMQNYLKIHFCRPIYAEFMEAAYLSGALDIPDFAANKRKYLACEWIAPGWPWVDPKNEVQSAVMSLGSGLTTLAEEAASRGKDWQEQLQQRAREQDFAKTLGLTLNINPAKGGNASENTDSQNGGEDGAGDPD
jgi:lambda family phage portal protein